MNFRKYLQLSALSAAFLPVFSYAQPVVLTTEVKQAMDRVSPDEVKQHIAYLADDKLKGRAPGTEGFQMAVDYVIEELKKVNVKPAGDKGGWTQSIRFRKAFAEDVRTSIDRCVDYKAAPNDFTVNPNPVLDKINVAAQLAFVGYGISEPKLGYDDYAGIDVKGKIVVVVRGVPESFSSSVAAHVQNSSTILRKAAEHGAIGVIVGAVDSVARGGFGGGAGGGGAAQGPAAPRGVMSLLDDKGRVVVSRSYESDKLKVYGNFRYPALKGVLQQEKQSLPLILADLKAGKPHSLILKATVTAQFRSRYEDMISYNVVGKIEGSDKKLKKEFVVHSAHLDHLGIGRPVAGDSIYNGAHDNASGVSSLLNIAKIYSNIPQKPKRSILVVFVTGEELGDLGSGYFAKKPTVPKGTMVADVNTDMPTIIAPLLSVTALGAEHSTLAAKVDQAAGYLGLGVEPDPEPKQARFTRSDQYSFVVNNIPALHIKYGAKTPDGKNNLNDLVAVWRAKYYHRAADDINGMFDFNAGKTYVQLNFLIGYLVAQDPVRPSWNPGDIFGM